MIAKNRKRLFSFSILTLLILLFAMPFTALADESIDLTDNDAAVAYITNSDVYDADQLTEEEAENYAVAADTFLESYSDNVSNTETFDNNLDKALIAKQDSVKPYATWLSLLPPIIAIALALITKEVYSSLFIGILSGALLYANFSFTGTIDHLFVDGFITSIADSYNIGIIYF